MAPTIVVQSPEKSSSEHAVPSKYHLYGWRDFRVGGILSRPVFSYVILCICTFVQNFTVNGANNAVISTLERVFYLDSVQSGLFLALYDLATVFSSPVVGYLGSRYSSPIFFSLNMIIVGIGNMMIASSNFVYRDKNYNFNYELVQSTTSFNNVLFQCYKDPSNGTSVTDTSCLRQERLSSSAQYAKLLLYAGNFVNGIGSVALFTIGIAYIERIFPRGKAAYCQGIYFAVGTVGGALGIAATGRFLLVFTKLTPRKRLPSWLTPSHPLWIGCWWLPYIIYGAVCFVIGLFVSGLPNHGEPGKKLTIEPITATQLHPPNASMIREDSPTSVTDLGSRPPTPILDGDSSESSSDLTHRREYTLPPLRSFPSDYRLSNRRVRQLSPLDPEPKLSASVTANDNAEGFVNHAYSIESLYNQLPATRSNLTAPSAVGHPTPSSSSVISDSSSSPAMPVRTAAENFKHMCSVIGELLKNPRYVFIIVANLFEGILIKGFVPFITKYFEYQHQLDTSTATLITAAIALLSVIIGCPIGAYLINRYSWTPMRCARVCAVIFTISSFLFLFLTAYCPELKFLHTSCSSENKPCCRNIYHPVCRWDNPNLMYLSPCHYGCVAQKNSSSTSGNLYSSCNCADNSTVSVSEAACLFRRVPCKLIFALTLTGATLVVFFTAMIQVPMLQVLLYSVALPYQSMALGLRQTIVRVLGQTTGPLLFGFVFDQACLVWLTDCYGRRTCKVYNNRQMGLSMAISGFTTRIISGISCGIVFIVWKYRNHDEGAVPAN